MPTSNSTEFRHARSGSLNIQAQAQAQAQQPAPPNGIMSAMPGGNRFDGPRSPPNTSHVPCKFYRQGACQAGNACPFSHDLGSAAETVCKYFAKGNCKFGPKCANIHMLPDGRRINYGKNGNLTIAPSPVALGARVNLTTYLPPSNSALTNSFLRADAVPHYPHQDDRYNHQLSHQPSMENTVPTIDTTQSSNPASAYGSPRDDDTMNRFNLGLSPNAKGLSVLDAPLPASFDSNGISHAARYGPWPSSVPSKFGLESPSSSLNAAKDARTSETLKLLHDSAFGSPGYQPLSAIGTGGIGGFGSSPPVGSAPYAGLGNDEFLGRKAMHSSSFRYSKPRAMSSSVPKVDRDWDNEFMFEEDYVPGALANEVLTAAEKARRGSNTNTVRGFDGMEATTESVPTGATKFGSPMAASPSRWGSFFQRQRDEEALESGSLGHVGSGRSIKASAFGHVGSPSAFGHVGSPLRNSSLASAITSELDGELSNGQSSRTGPEAMSALTQQIQRTRLGDDPSTGTSTHLSPNVPRYPSANGSGRMERHVSSGSIGSSGRFTAPIDEEDSSFVFSMEEEPEEDTEAKAARKRTSVGPLKSSSSGWSYASAAASNRNGASAANGGGSSRNGGAVEAVGGGK